MPSNTRVQEDTITLTRNITRQRHKDEKDETNRVSNFVHYSHFILYVAGTFFFCSDYEYYMKQDEEQWNSESHRKTLPETNVLFMMRDLL